MEVNHVVFVKQPSKVWDRLTEYINIPIGRRDTCCKLSCLLLSGIVYNYQAFQLMLIRSNVFHGNLEDMKWFPTISFALTAVFCAIFERLGTKWTVMSCVMTMLKTGHIIIMMGGLIMVVATLFMKIGDSPSNMLCVIGFGTIGAGAGAILVASFKTHKEMKLESKKSSNNSIQNTITIHGTTTVTFCKDASSIWPSVFVESGSAVPEFGIAIAIISFILCITTHYLTKNEKINPTTNTDDCETLNDVERGVPEAKLRIYANTIIYMCVFHILVVFNFFWYISTQLEQLKSSGGSASHDVVFLNNMLVIALPAGSVVYFIVGWKWFDDANHVRRMLVITFVSVIVPFSPALMTIIMGSAKAQIWAHIPAIIVTPFLRLYSWAVFLDVMFTLDTKKAMSAYGAGCAIVGLMTLGIYPLNVVLHGWYFPIQLFMACAILVGCSFVSYHVYGLLKTKYEAEK